MKILTLIFLSFILCSAGNAFQIMEQKDGNINTGSANIHYIQKGAGDSTLLFIHGWGINGSYWQKQLDYFSPNFKTIAIDLPGFGKSKAERENWTIEEYAADVVNFINKLNLKNVILIGHSMSGDIIIEAALKDKSSIIGVIGIDNFKTVNFQFTNEQKNQMNSFLDMLKTNYRNTAAAYSDMMLFHPSTGNDVKERVKKDIAESDSVVAISSIINVMNYSPQEAKKLKELDYKLYLVNSDAVPTFREGLEASCKNSFEIFEIHATGHYPMIEKPDEFNKLLEQAVNKIKQG